MSMQDNLGTSKCDHENCSHNVSNVSVHQTLDEMEFEKGIWSAAQQGDLNRVRKLLQKGTSVDQPDAAGYTALHYAARAGHEDVVNELLQARTNVNARTRAGQATSLQRAASAGKTTIVKLLLEKHASVTLQDADGKTALHRAAEGHHLEICKELINIDPSLKLIKDMKGNLPIDLVKNHDELKILLK